MSVNSKMTALADEIRELSGTSGTMGLDAMTSTLKQVKPEVSVNSANGLITATVGTKTSTHQLAFQPAKTITPTTTSQIAVSSGYYTGGDITVAAVSTQTKTVTPTSSTQNITPDSGKFLSKVTVNGDSDLVAGNIKSGVNIFGVTGTYVGSGGDTSAEDALITRTISIYSNDKATYVGCYAFAGCSKLTTVSFPAVTSIGGNAFQSCSNLTTVSFPAVTSIEDHAFYGCYSLTTVNFPAATSIEDYAFGFCSNLTTVNFPVAKVISNFAFLRCSSLTTVSFPAVTSIGGNAFQSCSNLTTVNFPAATSIGVYAFQSCSNLTTVNFPVVKVISNQAFLRCSSLTTISFPAVTSIGDSAFRSCYNLKSLYLPGSSVCNLLHSNVFNSTPIGGYSASAGAYGSIYVPASLLTSYKTATNWTYFSSRFVGIESSDQEEGGNNTIAFKIDSKEYKADAGMTWSEWVNSDYNTDSFMIVDDYVCNYNSDELMYNTGFTNRVRPSDEIIANELYVASGSGAGPELPPD